MISRKMLVIAVVTLLGALLLAGCSKSSGGGGEAGEAREIGEGSAQVVEPQMVADGFKQIEQDGFVLKWKVSGDNLECSVSSHTTGWVGVGFAPSNEMKDANIILGYVADGKAVVSDHFGTGNTAHRADTQTGGSANLIQSNATESNGVTEVSFVTPLDSGDSKDAKLTPGEVTTIILARGPDGSDNATTYHGQDGRVTLAIRL